MRPSDICTRLGWELGSSEDTAEGTYMVPDSRGVGPWYVHFTSLLPLDAISLEALPLSYVICLAHAEGPNDLPREMPPPLEVGSRYARLVPGHLLSRYLYDVVVPYLSKRLEIGI